MKKKWMISAAVCLAACLAGGAPGARAADKTIVYLSAGLEAPFWRYVSKGAEAAAKEGGYGFSALDSRNNAQSQAQNAQDAVSRNAAGIVLSPTDSSTAPAVLGIAAKAGIPVAFAGIGTTSGTYASFVTSEDEKGAYAVGAELAKAMKAKGWSNPEIGMVMISQARQNGRWRTNGFVKAITEAGGKVVAKNEMQLYTADETFRFVQDMLTAHPNLRGIFVQTDTPALGAARAISASRRRGETLLVAFDGVPEFVNLIKKGDLVASGMQQPFLMGKQAGEAVVGKLGGKEPSREIVLPILNVTKDNVDELLPTIRQTVFAGELK